MQSDPNMVCFFRDGDAVCAVFGDYVNMQESLFGCGETMGAALQSLMSQSTKAAARAAETLKLRLPTEQHKNVEVIRRFADRCNKLEEKQRELAGTIHEIEHLQARVERYQAEIARIDAERLAVEEELRRRGVMPTVLAVAAEGQPA